jgi:hypothetical protein
MRMGTKKNVSGGEVVKEGERRRNERGGDIWIPLLFF